MPEMDNPDGLRELVIVSGMSGAGRTEAMHVFEDLGYFCVDNLPPALICKLVDMRDFPTAPDVDNRIAVVCDVRSREFFEGLSNALRELDERKVNYRILFLDAEDEKLIARYKSSRRRHPLCEDGATISLGIERERGLLY